MLKMKKIVSKTTAKAKGKVHVFKCEYCVRKFCGLNALESHHRTQHNLLPFRRPKPYKKPKKGELKGNVNKLEAKKTVAKAPVIQSTMSTRRSSNVPISINTVYKDPHTPVTQTASTKTEYECPRCFLAFHSYLIAAQHIQKFHYGEKKVPMNVKPERKEWCWKCKRKVGSLPIHICGTDRQCDLLEKDPSVVYCCLGCNKKLSTLRLFYSHVVASHSNGLETLFFPTNKELSRWIQDVEYQTNARYSEIIKIDSKCYTHCTQATKNSLKVTNICPSIIMLQEFPKGLQVHFYGQHHQHTFKQYKLTNKFKKYSITSFLKVSDSYFQLKDLKSDDNDLYLQFKQLMESVVLDAAKLKKEALTVLFGKALEMTAVLTAYDNDDDDGSDDSTKPENKSMTAIDIEKALEEPPMVDNVSSEPHIKKMRPNLEAPSPMIVNSFSLADTVEDASKENNAIENTLKPNIKVRDLGSLQEPKSTNKDKDPKGKSLDSTPTSFSESFEVFVEKNFPGGEKGGDLPTKRSVRSNRPVRHKIREQFAQTLPLNVTPVVPQNYTNKPILRQYPSKRNRNSPKPVMPLQPEVQTPAVKMHSLPTMATRHKSNLDTVDVSQKLKGSNNCIQPATGKINNLSTMANRQKSNSDIADVPQKLKVSSNDIQAPTGKNNHLSIMATRQKLNSDTVNVSQKLKGINTSIDTSKTPKTYSIPDVSKDPVLERPKPITGIKRKSEIKPKKDIQYEVKEREDDCNILILKI